ncbi:MAG TPA: diguanylate cyclase [Gemmatimonadaceae bacterium]|nr:diguanylate cyclase [Gemmatimonadaceae bacterium]
MALLGTLLPAGITVGVAYVQNRRALEAKITQDLLSESSQTGVAISIWLKDRLYDLKVFAGSEEVSTNLARYATQGSATPRLREYLRSVHERIPDFEELMVLDPNGRVLATSAEQATPVTLPANWQRTMRQEGQVIGNAYWNQKNGRGQLIVAVPVHRIDGRLLGAFAVEMNLAPVQKELRGYQRDSVNGRIYLVDDSGSVVASSAGITPELLNTSLRPSIARRVRAQESAGLSYWNFEGREVLGAVKVVPLVPRWSVISELSQESAFQQVRDFRNTALMVIVGLLFVVAFTAYRLGLIIVRPLERLAEGAAEVAMGGLDVDLPETEKAGEVSALTKVFNEMVARLRQGRQELASVNERLRAQNQELERLSVTDGLTGLSNHRALMQRLNEETMRSRRGKHSFAVIMSDVDNFKQYNDTFGHPEGDVVLKKVAGILKEATRTVDCAARYGGEEFAILLPETDLAGALEVAERVRSRVEAAEFPGRKVTLSIGVAVYPKHGDTAANVIGAADAALYVAKRGGRNQVAQAAKAAGDDEKKLPSARAPRKSTAVRKKR